MSSVTGGGALTELLADLDLAADLRREAAFLPSWPLSQRQVWDIELLLIGAFAPLRGFLGRQDYDSVCADLRLQDGTLWPIPLTLDVSPEFAGGLSPGDRIALRHPEGLILAVMTVTDIWRADREAEARTVYGTSDETHPGVFQLLHQGDPVYLGGPVQGIDVPPHHTYQQLRHTPRQLRSIFADRGWDRIVAFQTRNPLHRAHWEITRQAMVHADAALLIHPAVGRSRPGDIDYFTRVRCYQAALTHYPPERTLLSLLPLAMRMAGPREALWHAIIRRNFGCTHFIIGRDHAAPGPDRYGRPFYAPYAAQDLARMYDQELGIQILTPEEMVYVEEENRYLPRSAVPPSARILSLSGTELRRRLREGAEIPEWFSFPEVIAELRRFIPARANAGLAIFLTGLPASGKSTLAAVLMAKLLEIATRPVTLLDGDVVRRHLSSELGFSREHRDINVRRIGYVASEIAKNGGVAICASIAPYQVTRREIREMVEEYGGFFEVYVSTPLDVCETRDRKGLYAKARAGLIDQFTGITDPYEPPDNPDLTLDLSQLTSEEGASRILQSLVARGHMKSDEVDTL